MLTCLRSVDFTEVELQRRSAVVDRRRTGDRLSPVEMPERDVAGRRREGRRRDGVLLDEVRGSLATAGRPPRHERVRQQEVDRVGRERERTATR